MQRQPNPCRNLNFATCPFQTTPTKPTFPNLLYYCILWQTTNEPTETKIKVKRREEKLESLSFSWGFTNFNVPFPCKFLSPKKTTLNVTLSPFKSIHLRKTIAWHFPSLLASSSIPFIWWWHRSRWENKGEMKFWTWRYREGVS